MLKNLPIIPSRTSQNFYPLFIIYSHSTVVYRMRISYYTRMVHTIRVWYVFLYHTHMVVPYRYMFHTASNILRGMEAIHQSLATQKLAQRLCMSAIASIHNIGYIPIGLQLQCNNDLFTSMTEPIAN